MIPKFHWQLRYPSELERFGKLCSCFCMERKHKICKRFGATVQNTFAFEKSMVEEMVAQEVHDLLGVDSFEEGPFLIEAHPPSKRLLDKVASAFSAESSSQLKG